MIHDLAASSVSDFPRIYLASLSNDPFSDLKRILKEKLEQKIPVITVVGVAGTTEESAVDPVTAIVDLRQKFRMKVS